MVPLKYCKVKVAKEIAKAVDNVIRKETGVEIDSGAAYVTGVIVIRFKKDGASSTLMGDIRIRDAIDIFDQLLNEVMPRHLKEQVIPVA